MAEVVTGEAVVLDVPCARFPSRLLALAIDLLIQAITLICLLVIVGLASARGGLDAASSAAASLTALVLVIVGYPVTWETLSGGASPGKFALGLRVVSDDGSPVRFRQALVRGLASAVEIWGLAGAPALICSVLSSRGKRLGDVFAGTFVIQQRLPSRHGMARPPAVAPHLSAWAAGLQMSGLTDQTADAARRYLARVPELAPGARDQLGRQIATVVSTEVSPPPPAGTPVQAYLAAVLAERRRREDARLASPGRPGPGSGERTAPPPGPSPAVAASTAGAALATGRAEAPWKEERAEAPWKDEGGTPGTVPQTGQASGSGEAPTGFAPPA